MQGNPDTTAQLISDSTGQTVTFPNADEEEFLELGFSALKYPAKYPYIATALARHQNGVIERAANGLQVSKNTIYKVIEWSKDPKNFHNGKIGKPILLILSITGWNWSL